MKRKSTLTFKVIAGIACFSSFLTVSSEFSRSQSEKPEIQPTWNPGKNVLLATAVPVQPRPFHLGVPEFVVKETPKMIREKKQEKNREEKISTQEPTPRIPKVRESALLDHTELQAMVNDLDYEIFPGRGVRFRYSDLPDDHMGHMWFLKRPRDLRGKTVRIDYRGYVPEEMTFKIARSGTSAAVIQKIKLESSPYEPRSIFIDIPDKFPFKDVKYFEFWIDRESALRRHGDFTIEKVVILEATEKAKMQAIPPEESRPERFPFDQPFMPTNLMRAEVRAS